MSNASSICPACGSELPRGLPAGLCPRCALEAAAGLTDDATRATQSIPLSQSGDRIGRYKLLQKIGEGGMGDVWMAEQSEPFRRKVALKVIKLGMDSRSVIARFEAERQALALMDHPNIAKVLDAGATETGRPYFVMELVRGVRVTEYCDQHNLTTRARLDLFMQVCHAIQHAHQKGIIHRDIKPSNILVTLHDGVPVPKVIDFGIAKATSDQRLTDKTLFTAFEQFMGTPAYMSPEQAEMSGLDIDTRTDIYSLGVLLYELLTGKTPFDGKELLASGLDAMRRTIREKEPTKPSTRLDTMLEADLTEIAKHRQTEPNKLSSLLRRDLDWVVMKALEKDRTRRYETAGSLAADIQRHLRHEPVIACPPTGFYRFQKMVRRNKLAVAAITAIATVLLLGGIISSWQAVRATRAERTQSILRNDAENARTTAQTEARRAEAAALEAKMTLATSDFIQSVRLIAEDKGSDALPYLVRSLSANPTNFAALVRLTTWLTYHTWMRPAFILTLGNGVTSAQFSPDGRRILTLSTDDTARMWDLQTGQPLTGPMKHHGMIISAQFSPDGNRIVTASTDTTARVWDANTGKPLTETMKHEETTIGFTSDRKRLEAISSAQFSPDGNRIITASLAPRITSVRATNGVRQLPSPSGTRVRAWNAHTGQALAGQMSYFDDVLFAQLSPDGKRIVTIRSRTTQVGDAETGDLLSKPMLHDDAVRLAQFSPDGQRLLTASGKKLQVWNAQSGQRLHGSLDHISPVFSVQFNITGDRIVTASHDGIARVWNGYTLRPLTEPMKHKDKIVSAWFSPDAKQIITASQAKVWVWGARTGHAIAERVKHKGMIHSVQFSPDAKRIVAVSWDKTARVWDANTGKPLTEAMKHEETIIGFTSDRKRLEAISSAQFSPDGKRIITASSDDTARVWDAQTGQPLTEPMRHEGPIISARFSPDAKRIVTASSDKTARVWDAQTGKALTELFQHRGPVVSVQFSPDAKRIVTTSTDNTARVWDAQSGQPVSEPMKHEGSIRSAQFSPDGKRIITASSDSTARVWDAQTGQALAEPFKHRDSVAAAQFSPDGKRIVTASDDHTARVWDAQTGQALAEPFKHNGSVVSAQFSPDGRFIVTASRDNTARLWDAQTGQALAEPFEHDGQTEAARFSPDGKRIVTVSRDSLDYTASFWDIAPTETEFPDWLLPLAEAISGQVLNEQGVLEETKLNRVETLNRIQQRLNQEIREDAWVVWGRWLLADRATRTISPFSQVKDPTGGQ